jgi:Excalibur calcium-binding domain
VKKLLIPTLILGLSLSGNPANAAARVFKNCTEMNKVYPGGVAKVGAVNQGGVTKNEPNYDNELYEANKKSDRDKDDIACEK